MENMKNKKQTCCICGKEFEGFGHNPEPVMRQVNGRCCDQCNFHIVLANRILRLKGHPQVGDKIHIISMEGEPQYSGKEGTITHIDSIGQLHGDWGGCGILPDVDEFYITK